MAFGFHDAFLTTNIWLTLYFTVGRQGRPNNLEPFGGLVQYAGALSCQAKGDVGAFCLNSGSMEGMASATSSGMTKRIPVSRRAEVCSICSAAACAAWRSTSAFCRVIRSIRVTAEVT